MSGWPQAESPVIDRRRTGRRDTGHASIVTNPGNLRWSANDAGRPFDRVVPGNSQHMGDFMDRAKNAADQHDDQVDKGLERAGDEVDERTGGKHGDKIDKGVDEAQERTGQGDQSA